MDIGFGFFFFFSRMVTFFSRCSRVEGRQCHETRCLHLFALPLLIVTIQTPIFSFDHFVY